LTLFTGQVSPVSNSNLIFVREQLGTGSALSVCFFRLIAIYV
jgi:hypothetical protein